MDVDKFTTYTGSSLSEIGATNPSVGSIEFPDGGTTNSVPITAVSKEYGRIIEMLADGSNISGAGEVIMKTASNAIGQHSFAPGVTYNVTDTALDGDTVEAGVTALMKLVNSTDSADIIKIVAQNDGILKTDLSQSLSLSAGATTDASVGEGATVAEGDLLLTVKDASGNITDSVYSHFAGTVSFSSDSTNMTATVSPTTSLPTSYTGLPSGNQVSFYFGSIESSILSTRAGTFVTEKVITQVSTFTASQSSTINNGEALFSMLDVSVKASEEGLFKLGDNAESTPSMLAVGDTLTTSTGTLKKVIASDKAGTFNKNDILADGEIISITDGSLNIGSMIADVKADNAGVYIHATALNIGATFTPSDVIGTVVADFEAVLDGVFETTLSVGDSFDQGTATLGQFSEIDLDAQFNGRVTNILAPNGFTLEADEGVFEITNDIVPSEGLKDAVLSSYAFDLNITPSQASRSLVSSIEDGTYVTQGTPIFILSPLPGDPAGGASDTQILAPASGIFRIRGILPLETVPLVESQSLGFIDEVTVSDGDVLFKAEKTISVKEETEGEINFILSSGEHVISGETVLFTSEREVNASEAGTVAELDYKKYLVKGNHGLPIDKFFSAGVTPGVTNYFVKESHVNDGESVLTGEKLVTLIEKDTGETLDITATHNGIFYHVDLKQLNKSDENLPTLITNPSLSLGFIEDFSQKIYVEDGTYVQKGEILVRFEGGTTDLTAPFSGIFRHSSFLQTALTNNTALEEGTFVGQIEEAEIEMGMKIGSYTNGNDILATDAGKFIPSSILQVGSVLNNANLSLGFVEHDIIADNDGSFNPLVTTGLYVGENTSIGEIQNIEVKSDREAVFKLAKLSNGSSFYGATHSIDLDKLGSLTNEVTTPLAGSIRYLSKLNQNVQNPELDLGSSLGSIDFVVTARQDGIFKLDSNADLSKGAAVDAQNNDFGYIETEVSASSDDNFDPDELIADTVNGIYDPDGDLRIGRDLSILSDIGRVITDIKAEATGTFSLGAKSFSDQRQLEIGDDITIGQSFGYLDDVDHLSGLENDPVTQASKVHQATVSSGGNNNFGQIEEIFVNNGEFVEKGSLIMHVSDDVLIDASNFDGGKLKSLHAGLTVSNTQITNSTDGTVPATPFSVVKGETVLATITMNQGLNLDGLEDQLGGSPVIDSYIEILDYAFNVYPEEANNYTLKLDTSHDDKLSNSTGADQDTSVGYTINYINPLFDKNHANYAASESAMNYSDGDLLFSTKDSSLLGDYAGENNNFDLLNNNSIFNLENDFYSTTTSPAQAIPMHVTKDVTVLGIVNELEQHTPASLHPTREYTVSGNVNEGPVTKGELLMTLTSSIHTMKFDHKDDFSTDPIAYTVHQDEGIVEAGITSIITFDAPYEVGYVGGGVPLAATYHIFDDVSKTPEPIESNFAGGIAIVKGEVLMTLSGSVEIKAPVDGYLFKDSGFDPGTGDITDLTKIGEIRGANLKAVESGIFYHDSSVPTSAAGEISIGEIKDVQKVFATNSGTFATPQFNGQSQIVKGSTITKDSPYVGTLTNAVILADRTGIFEIDAALLNANNIGDLDLKAAYNSGSGDTDLKIGSISNEVRAQYTNTRFIPTDTGTSNAPAHFTVGESINITDIVGKQFDRDSDSILTDGTQVSKGTLIATVIDDQGVEHEVKAKADGIFKHNHHYTTSAGGLIDDNDTPRPNGIAENALGYIDEVEVIAGVTELFHFRNDKDSNFSAAEELFPEFKTLAEHTGTFHLNTESLTKKGLLTSSNPLLGMVDVDYKARYTGEFYRDSSFIHVSESTEGTANNKIGFEISSSTPSSLLGPLLDLGAIQEIEVRAENSGYFKHTEIDVLNDSKTVPVTGSFSEITYAVLAGQTGEFTLDGTLTERDGATAGTILSQGSAFGELENIEFLADKNGKLFHGLGSEDTVISNFSGDGSLGTVAPPESIVYASDVIGSIDNIEIKRTSFDRYNGKYELNQNADMGEVYRTGHRILGGEEILKIADIEIPMLFDGVVDTSNFNRGDSISGKTSLGDITINMESNYDGHFKADAANIATSTDAATGTKTHKIGSSSSLGHFEIEYKALQDGTDFEFAEGMNPGSMFVYGGDYIGSLRLNDITSDLTGIFDLADDVETVIKTPATTGTLTVVSFSEKIADGGEFEYDEVILTLEDSGVLHEIKALSIGTFSIADGLNIATGSPLSGNVTLGNFNAPMQAGAVLHSDLTKAFELGRVEYDLTAPFGGLFSKSGAITDNSLLVADGSEYVIGDLDGISTGTKVITLKGTLDDVNAALDDITYSPDSTFHGEDIMRMTVLDNGSISYMDSEHENIDTSQSIIVSDFVSLVVYPKNDAPVITGIPDLVDATIKENETIIIDTIEIADPDFTTSGTNNFAQDSRFPLKITVEVTGNDPDSGETNKVSLAIADNFAGLADLSRDVGIIPTNKDSTVTSLSDLKYGAQKITFTGSLDSINVAIKSLRFHAAPNFNDLNKSGLNTGIDYASIKVTVDDLNNIDVSNLNLEDIGIKEGTNAFLAVVEKLNGEIPRFNPGVSGETAQLEIPVSVRPIDSPPEIRKAVESFLIQEDAVNVSVGAEFTLNDDDLVDYYQAHGDKERIGYVLRASVESGTLASNTPIKSIELVGDSLVANSVALKDLYSLDDFIELDANATYILELNVNGASSDDLNYTVAPSFTGTYTEGPSDNLVITGTYAELQVIFDTITYTDAAALATDVSIDLEISSQGQEVNKPISSVTLTQNSLDGSPVALNTLHTLEDFIGLDASATYTLALDVNGASTDDLNYTVAPSFTGTYTEGPSDKLVITGTYAELQVIFDTITYTNATATDVSIDLEITTQRQEVLVYGNYDTVSDVLTNLKYSSEENFNQTDSLDISFISPFRSETVELALTDGVAVNFSTSFSLLTEDNPAYDEDNPGATDNTIEYILVLTSNNPANITYTGDTLTSQAVTELYVKGTYAELQTILSTATATPLVDNANGMIKMALIDLRPPEDVETIKADRSITSISVLQKNDAPYINSVNDGAITVSELSYKGAGDFGVQSNQTVYLESLYNLAASTDFNGVDEYTLTLKVATGGGTLSYSENTETPTSELVFVDTYANLQAIFNEENNVVYTNDSSTLAELVIDLDVSPLKTLTVVEDTAIIIGKGLSATPNFEVFDPDIIAENYDNEDYLFQVNVSITEASATPHGDSSKIAIFDGRTSTKEYTQPALDPAYEATFVIENAVNGISVNGPSGSTPGDLLYRFENPSIPGSEPIEIRAEKSGAFYITSPVMPLGPITSTSDLTLGSITSVIESTVELYDKLGIRPDVISASVATTLSDLQYGAKEISFKGTLSAINTALESLYFIPAKDSNNINMANNPKVTITVDDQLNIASDTETQSLSSSIEREVILTPSGDAPLFSSFPIFVKTQGIERIIFDGLEDTSDTDQNRHVEDLITLFDIEDQEGEGGTELMRLTIETTKTWQAIQEDGSFEDKYGALTLGNTNGLTITGTLADADSLPLNTNYNFISGRNYIAGESAEGGTSLVLVGSISDINLAVKGLTYDPYNLLAGLGKIEFTLEEINATTGAVITVDNQELKQTRSVVISSTAFNLGPSVYIATDADNDAVVITKLVDEDGLATNLDFYEDPINDYKINGLIISDPDINFGAEKGLMRVSVSTKVFSPQFGGSAGSGDNYGVLKLTTQEEEYGLDGQAGSNIVLTSPVADGAYVRSGEALYYLGSTPIISNYTGFFHHTNTLKDAIESNLPINAAVALGSTDEGILGHVQYLPEDIVLLSDYGFSQTHAGWIEFNKANDMIEFEGTLESIQSIFNGVKYRPAENFNGTEVITFKVDDQGYTNPDGSRGLELTDDLSLTFTVKASDDAPVLDLSNIATSTAKPLEYIKAPITAGGSYTIESMPVTSSSVVETGDLLFTLVQGSGNNAVYTEVKAPIDGIYVKANVITEGSIINGERHIGTIIDNAKIDSVMNIRVAALTDVQFGIQAIGANNNALVSVGDLLFTLENKADATTLEIRATQNGLFTYEEGIAAAATVSGGDALGKVITTSYFNRNVENETLRNSGQVKEVYMPIAEVAQRAPDASYKVTQRSASTNTIVSKGDLLFTLNRLDSSGNLVSGETLEIFAPATGTIVFAWDVGNTIVPSNTLFTTNVEYHIKDLAKDGTGVTEGDLLMTLFKVATDGTGDAILDLTQTPSYSIIEEIPVYSTITGVVDHGLSINESTDYQIENTSNAYNYEVTSTGKLLMNIAPAQKVSLRTNEASPIYITGIDLQDVDINEDSAGLLIATIESVHGTVTLDDRVFGLVTDLTNFSYTPGSAYSPTRITGKIEDVEQALNLLIYTPTVNSMSLGDDLTADKPYVQDQVGITITQTVGDKGDIVDESGEKVSSAALFEAVVLEVEVLLLNDAPEIANQPDFLFEHSFPSGVYDPLIGEELQEDEAYIHLIDANGNYLQVTDPDVSSSDMDKPLKVTIAVHHGQITAPVFEDGTYILERYAFDGTNYTLDETGDYVQQEDGTYILEENGRYELQGNGTYLLDATGNYVLQADGSYEHEKYVNENRVSSKLLISGDGKKLELTDSIDNLNLILKELRYVPDLDHNNFSPSASPTYTVIPSGTGTSTVPENEVSKFIATLPSDMVATYEQQIDSIHYKTTLADFVTIKVEDLKNLGGILSTEVGDLVDADTLAGLNTNGVLAENADGSFFTTSLSSIRDFKISLIPSNDVPTEVKVYATSYASYKPLPSVFVESSFDNEEAYVAFLNNYMVALLTETGSSASIPLESNFATLTLFKEALQDLKAQIEVYDPVTFDEAPHSEDYASEAAYITALDAYEAGRETYQAWLELQNPANLGAVN
ncbi:hypothetical protein AB751O23_AU_00010, partial [Chlamydiales bacterium SCGC AB-751-O23]